MTELKEKIIVIGGPTCVGKSDFGVELALRYNGEIIGADSVQIYKFLDVGSGKITKEEMKGISHHLIDIKMPYESFSVVDFLTAVKPVIADIAGRGKLPIIVGGTGFYINALLHGFNCGHAGPNYPLRDRLKCLEETKSGCLYDALLAIDPDTEVRINDLPRIIRQLELFLSPVTEEGADQPNYVDACNALVIVMDADRAKLDELAAGRIKNMLDGGLLQEVAELKRFHKFRCMASVGYAEVIQGLDTGMSREEIEENMRLGYHALIKKQQTYFRWMKWNRRVNVYNWDYSAAEQAVGEFLNEV